MRRNRTPITVAIALTLCALAPVRPGAAQQAPPKAPAPPVPGEPAPQPEQPVFRATVDLVRVDVSVTGRNDEPVADLKAGDFDVFEDEALQKVETAQFVRLDGERHVDDGEPLDIRSPEHAAREAAKDDVRVFAIFYDDYHIDKSPTITMPLRRAIEKFIEQLKPTDLVVIMDPLTTLDGLKFTRSRSDLLARVHTFEGRRGEIFPVKSAVEEAQLSQRNVFELRAGVTLSALEALATRLGGLREGRKSILFISQGPPVGTPGSPNYPRLEAALQAANRGNVTINVLDPRPLGSAPFGGSEALQRLAAETGGRAIVNTNDPSAGLTHVIADASAYYLLGYSPTHERSDGKFHKITVKVRRPGVRVLARRGYWAPKPEETNAAPAPAPDPVLATALTALSTSPTNSDSRVVDVWMGSSPGDAGVTTLSVTWDPMIGDADPPARLEVEPVSKTDNKPLGPMQAIGAAPKAGDAATVATFELAPGTAALRMTAKSSAGVVLDRWTQAVAVPDYTKDSLWLTTPRVYRARSPYEARALAASPSPTPAATRHFRRTDQLFIEVEARSSVGEAVVLTAQLTNRAGKVLAPLEVPAAVNGRVRLQIPMTSLAPSIYVIRFDATAGEHQARQMVAFAVSQ
jgi:VWFA-related protein